MIAAKDMNVSRQYPLVATQRFDFSQLVSGEAIEIVKIPFNSIVTGGSLILTAAFDSGDSDAITVGDDGGNATADADRYLTLADAQATGLSALVPTGFQFLTMGAVTLTWTGVGTVPTAGAGILVVEYVTEGRHSFEVVPSY